MRWLAPLLLLVAAASGTSGDQGTTRQTSPPPPRTGNATARDRTLLRRAAAIDAWFVAHHRQARKKEKVPTPKAWTVTRKEDVRGPWREIGNESRMKRVFRARIGDIPVIVKRQHGAQSGAFKGDDNGGNTLYREIIYLEGSRGEPGIPKLYGAWFDGPHVLYVTQDCGAPLGDGPPTRVTARRGEVHPPAVLATAFARRAATDPLGLARALLACFGSWTAAGWLQDDFRAQQFTMDGTGRVYLVDGPQLLANWPLGRQVLQTWSSRHRGTNADSAARGRDLNLYREPCGRDADCPFTRESHSCHTAGICERGSRGAPESRGKCRHGFCLPLSDKTHVWDVANRPWLLPFIAEKATGAERDLLRSLMGAASAERPEDRPSFQELVRRIDVFAKQARSRRRRQLLV